MIASEILTPERIAEIMAFPITYDEDCPKLTKEQLAELRPAHPENFAKGKRQKITVYVDSDALEKFNAKGLDLEAYINSSVRSAVAGWQMMTASPTRGWGENKGYVNGDGSQRRWEI